MSLRLFIGLAIPQTVWPHLTKICDSLPNVRWQKPENLHVTLKFIGKTDQDSFDRIDFVLKSLSLIQSAIALNIRDVGIFGKPPEVRALWAGVEPTPDILTLQQLVEDKLESIGIPKEQRPYLPHVTLAKPKKNTVPLIEDYLEQHRDFKLKSFLVNELILFSSHGGTEGSEYRVEKSYLLKG